MARTRPSNGGDGSDGGGDSRGDDRDERPPEVQEKMRERARERAPEPTSDASERVSETIEARREAERREKQLTDRAPEPAPNASERVSATIVERRRRNRNESIDTDIPERRDVNTDSNPTAPTSTAVRQESDGETFTDQAIDRAAELEDTVSGLPGVSGVTERIKTGAALAAAGAGATRDFAEPVTEPVVSASRDARESVIGATEGVADAVEIPFAGERSQRVENAVSGFLEGGGRTAADLTVGLPATTSDALDAGVAATEFTAEQIDERGFVRGTATTTDAAATVATEAAQSGGRALSNRPAETLGEFGGSLAVGFGAGTAASKGVRAVSRTNVDVPSARQFVGDERGMAGGQRTITVERQEQKTAREIDEATPLDEVPREVAENRRRQAELELEQQAPEGQTIRTMFESEEARARAIERRATRDILEERAPFGESLEDMIPDAELRSEQIAQARSRLFERESESEIESQQTARATTETDTQQQTAASATGGRATTAELEAFMQPGQSRRLDAALAGLAGGASAAEASAVVEPATDQRIITAFDEPTADQDEATAYAEPTVDQRITTAFDEPTADQDEATDYAEPTLDQRVKTIFDQPRGEQQEATRTLERTGQRQQTVTETVQETTTETTVDQQLEQTLPTPTPTVTLTTTRFRDSGSRTVRLDEPDPDSEEFRYFPRVDDSAESWRSPVAQADDVLDAVFGIDDGGDG